MTDTIATRTEAAREAGDVARKAEQEAEAAALRAVELGFDQRVLDSNLRKLVQPKAPQQTGQQALG